MKNIVKSLFYAISLMAIAVSCGKEPSQPTVAVTGIALNKTTLSLKEGEEFTLIPTVTPDNAADKSVSWSCDNEAVVTVSAEGVVKALKAGKAIVTATTVDQSKTASCSIEVAEGMSAVTGAATHISCRNAEISGKANLPGTTFTDLSFGVIYSTSSGVLIGSATQIAAKTFDAEYNYTVNTEILEPETTYYYRSYIIQDKEVSYGEVKSFTTLAVSSMIQTLDATEINPKDAVLNAFFDLTDCKYDALEYGFEVTPEDGNSHTIKSSNHSEKKFSAEDESLSRDTKYSVVAYVKLDGRTYKGEAKTFTTTSVKASVTAESSAVDCKTATISGKLTVVSAGTFTKSAELYYSSTASTLEALKSSGTKKTLTLGSDGSYRTDLTSLESNTQYNYVVIAKVDEIELKTEVKTFKTLQIVASVTAESSNVSCNSATISGRLTVESEDIFTKSAELYYSSTASTLEALKSSGTKKTLTLGPNGSYSIGLTSLKSNTQYNYVVIAKVDEIELKTEVKTFKTLQIVASVTAESSNVSYDSATISGKLIVESAGSFTKSAVLYYSSTASTLEALKSSGTKKTLTLGPDGSYSIGLTSLEFNTQYNYVIIANVDEIEFKTEVKTFKTLAYPELVDLGLSVKWRGWNLGASKPEDYGGEYQWAGKTDVTDKSIYLGWSYCPYHRGSDYSIGWMKYIPSSSSSYWSNTGSPDNKTVLDPEDDVAHVKLGGKWRMPTRAEWEELINTSNCSWTWTSINGINGYKVQSKKSGYTGNWIFLPATCHAGSYGYYWSSSLGADYPDLAYELYFFSGRAETARTYRYSGLSVRPVSE